MSFYILMSIIFIGFLSTYIFGIKYLKALRGESSSNLNDVSILVTSILFGGPVCLFLYAMFSEIRFEDSTKKHRFLIVSIVLTILQVALVVILFCTGVINFATQDQNVEANLLRFLSNH